MADTTLLPVPNQLKAQLQKCKTVRSADTYCKSREKSPQEMVDSRSKLPPLLPVDTKK